MNKFRNKIGFFRINVGLLIVRFGKWVQPDYWVCFNCGYIECKESEIICPKCRLGEMIYKGKV